MKIDRIDTLLNDQEINYLADLFLARYGLSRGTRRYRYFKNAVILFSHDFLSHDEAYRLLAECADMELSQFKDELRSAVSQLDTPIYETFNRTFNPPPLPYEKPHKDISMSASDDPDYILTFLGITFLYLIVSNYPKYEYISYCEQDK